MSKEVFVVRQVENVFDGSAGASPYNVSREVSILGVFDSVEKARAYCEDSSNYPDYLDEYPESDKPRTWDEDGTVYSVLEHQDPEFSEDYIAVFFVVKAYVLQ